MNDMSVVQGLGGLKGVPAMILAVLHHHEREVKTKGGRTPHLVR